MRFDIGNAHISFSWLAVVLFLAGGLIFFLRDPEGRPWRRPWRWAVVAVVGLFAFFPIALLPAAYAYGRGWLPSAICDPVYGAVRSVLNCGPDPIGEHYAKAYQSCFNVGYRHEYGEEEWLGGISVFPMDDL
jgi:peptidoglycan/LPS O-acetylase OafA/YrhL